MISTKELYQKAKPFPHAVIDGLFRTDELVQVIDQWPVEGWRQHRHTKRAHTGMGQLDIFQKLLSDEFVADLSEMSGIDGLVADPTLYGGGLHETMAGGKLGIHVDFNVHEQELNLYRRLNLLLYLNPFWDHRWNGNLELWQGDDSGPKYQSVQIAPRFNRTVIFTTSENCWHGHPHVFNPPDGMTRRSIASYYYTKEKPEWMAEQHSTIYKEPPK